MKKLPIGIQTFEEIITEDYQYVDKTDFVYNLAHSGKVYFLSRPRRFGKSLLISTLDAYFSGRKELFDGLKIARLEKEWKQYPVIRIDFGAEDYFLEGHLESQLDNVLTNYETQYGITPKDSATYAVRFGNLIRSIATQTQKKVVVLIDEYDSPILDALYEPHKDRNYAELRAFYSVLKANDAYLKFVFLTGITRISHVNIFSGLNQLQDISMNEKYAAICGITKQELKSKFKGWIGKMAKKNDMTVDECVAELKRMYDGYHFSKNSPDMYNPYSLLNAFSAQEFGSYWYGSGTPTSLMNVLKHQEFDLSQMLDNPQVYEESFDNFRPNGTEVLPLIYQSGYLTIKSYDKESKLYTLGLPNQEVRDGFFKSLLPSLSQISDSRLGFTADSYYHALRECDMQGLVVMSNADGVKI